MRTKSRPMSDDMRREYEFDYSTAIRGKYYRRLLQEGANIVVLESNVAKAFRSSSAANEALRSLLEVLKSTRRLTTRSTRGTPASRRLRNGSKRRATGRVG